MVRCVLKSLIAAVLLLSPHSSDAQTTPAHALRTGAVAAYRVSFESTWSESTHPQDFPGNPHFSGLIGATHDAGVSFWEVASHASPGIESMAETGGKSLLTDEVNIAISSGRAEFLLSGGGISVSPGAVSLEFGVSQDFPLVTLVSMLAPSPDWFVGVSGLNLYEGGDWAQRVEVPLVVYDAGTDSGTSYASANADTDPQEPVVALTEAPFDARQQVGTFVFELRSGVGIDEEIPEDFGGVTVFPNPSHGPVFVEVRGEAGVVEVSDMLGRLLERRSYGRSDGRIDLDLSRYPAGVYAVVVSVAGRTVVRPVVLIRE